MRRRRRRTSPERVAMDEGFGIACRKKLHEKTRNFFQRARGCFLNLEFRGSDQTILKKIGLRSHQNCCQCVASKTCAKGQKWALLMISGRRDLLLRNLLIKKWWAELDSNQRRRKPADLQSAPFGHFGIYPFTESPAGNATGLRERIHVGRARWI